VSAGWGAGYHASRHPNDGLATSVGTRLACASISPGTVARIDHVTGRDEATDVDADGDDTSTG
jgi:hypothetical protein